MSAATSEIVWLQHLLKIMGLQQQVTPLLLCDNLSAVCLSANPMFHKRTKHFDVDYHYVRERVAMKALEVKHIPATLQIADVFTKPLSHEAFAKWRSKLGVASYAKFEGEYRPYWFWACEGSPTEAKEGDRYFFSAQDSVFVVICKSRDQEMLA